MAATVSTTMQNAADTAAGAAANGAKNAAYLTSIISSIGSGYKIKAYRNGVAQIAMTMTGSMTASGSTITIPTSYASLDTLLTADIDSGTWTLRIEKASDANVYIEGSLGPAGGSTDFTLSFDTTSGGDVLLGSIKLIAPSYDTVSDTASTNNVQKIFQDVTGANDGYMHRFPTFFNDTTLRDPSAVLMGSYPVGSAFTGWGYWWDSDPNVLAEYKDDDFWTHFWGWGVLHEEGTSQYSGSTRLNTATNLRLGIRNCVVAMRRKSTGVWQELAKTNSPGWFRAFETNHRYADGSVDLRNNNTDGGQELLLPAGAGYSYHFVAPGYKMDLSSIVADIDAIHVCCQVRLVLDNPAGTDDRANAKWMIYVGGDWMPNGTSEVGQDGRPGYALSRLKRMRTDGNWEWINCINILEQRQDNNNPSRHSVPYASIVANPPTFY